MPTNQTTAQNTAEHIAQTRFFADLNNENELMHRGAVRGGREMGGSLRLGLFVAMCASSASAIMYDYNEVALPSQSVLVSTHGIYGAADGDSAFVHVDLTASMVLPLHQSLHRKERLHLALVEHSNKDINSLYVCHDNGDLDFKRGPDGKSLVTLVRDDDGHAIVHLDIRGSKLSAQSTARFPVTQDGLYSLLLARCMPPNPDGDHTVQLNGKVEWLSQYGKLPGEFTMLLYFYQAITLIYFVVLVAWCHRICIHREMVINLQWGVFIVLILNFLESLVCFLNYARANATGQQLDQGTAFVFTEVFRVLSDTVCRCFLLLVCLGLGVIVDRLPDSERSKVAGFTCVYFIFKLVDHLTAVTPAPVSDVLLLMDSGLMVWLFLALAKAEKQLMTEGPMTDATELKVEMYQSTRFLLVMFAAVVSICFLGLYMQYDILPWTWAWIRHSFEDCIVFLIIFYFSIAWLPSEDTAMYAPVELEMTAMGIS